MVCSEQGWAQIDGRPMVIVKVSVSDCAHVGCRPVLFVAVAKQVLLGSFCPSLGKKRGQPDAPLSIPIP